MARPLRIEYPGAIYHITQRGNNKCDIYVNSLDRLTFLFFLSLTIETYHWLCHAYCLMNNHYHLLIETPEGNLSDGMQHLNSVYAQAHNKKHNRVGHLFQGRYKSFLIEKEFYLLEVARYIVLNPVRAKLVRHPKNWVWSSYRLTAGIDDPVWFLTTDWILEKFSSNSRVAQAMYEEFVHDGIKADSPFQYASNEGILGSQQFVHFIRDEIDDGGQVEEISQAEKKRGRLSLEDIFTKEVLSEKKRKEEAIMLARILNGYRLKQIADHLGLHYSTVSKILNKNEKSGNSRSDPQ